MIQDLVYVELKSGYNDNGPAWIGRPAYSKSKSTVYFNGLAFQSLKGSGVNGNYFDTNTGDEYWISGIKKDGKDRHWAGRGKIEIDTLVAEEYMHLLSLKSLPNNIIPFVPAASKPSPEFLAQENEILNQEKNVTLGRRPITKKNNGLGC